MISSKHFHYTNDIFFETIAMCKWRLRNISIIQMTFSLKQLQCAKDVFEKFPLYKWHFLWNNCNVQMISSKHFHYTNDIFFETIAMCKRCLWNISIIQMTFSLKQLQCANDIFETFPLYNWHFLWNNCNVQMISSRHFHYTNDIFFETIAMCKWRLRNISIIQMTFSLKQLQCAKDVFEITNDIFFETIAMCKWYLRNISIIQMTFSLKQLQCANDVFETFPLYKWHFLWNNCNAQMTSSKHFHYTNDIFFETIAMCKWRLRNISIIQMTFSLKQLQCANDIFETFPLYNWHFLWNNCNVQMISSRHFHYTNDIFFETIAMCKWYLRDINTMCKWHLWEFTMCYKDIFEYKTYYQP